MFNEEEGIAGGAGMETNETEGAAGGAGKTERTYIVQAGDTLSKIAKEYYGDAGKYMDIFNANTEQLSDPNKIKVGQELIIP